MGATGYNSGEVEHGDRAPPRASLYSCSWLVAGPQRAGPYEKGSKEAASGSGPRGGGIPESFADREGCENLRDWREGR